jgi:hypothetical protein
MFTGLVAAIASDCTAHGQFAFEKLRSSASIVYHRTHHLRISRDVGLCMAAPQSRKLKAILWKTRLHLAANDKLENSG